MNVVLAAMGVVFALAGHASPKPPLPRGSTRAAAVRSSPARTAAVASPVLASTPFPMLPRIARVRVEAAQDRVVLIEEVSLPRGDWQGGPLDLYVAFGAPGTPIAMDAALVALAPDALESRLEDAGDAVAIEPAVRGAGAQTLVGRSQMAGVAIHLKDAALRRALAPSGVAALRIRSLLHAPAADANGARTLVVRLGVSGGLPMTLGAIEFVPLERAPWLTRVQSSLCGADAEPWLLATAILQRPSVRAAPDAVTIAPDMAVRHPTDDLCVRWWAAASTRPAESTARF